MALDGCILGSYPNARFVLADHGEGGCWLLFDSPEGQLAKISPTMAELYSTGGFAAPRCMDYDPVEDVLWIADTDHDEMVKVNPADGSVITRFDGFDAPVAVSVNYPGP